MVTTPTRKVIGSFDANSHEVRRNFTGISETPPLPWVTSERALVKTLATRVVAMAIVIASLAVAAPAVAGTKGPTPLQEYHLALKAYNHEVAVINKTFATAVKTARANEATALKIAGKNTKKQLRARQAYTAAINVAVENRQSALAALGPPPQPPVAGDPGSSASTTTTTTLAH